MATAATTDTEVLQRTTALVPLLAHHAQRAEQQRRVVPECLEALTEAGVFRLTLPRDRGGFESSLERQCEVLAEVSRGCASTGWVATIYTAMIWNACLFPDEAQDEVFASPDVRVAAVFAPSATATPVGGGVRVSGRWAFNTGCHHAHWAILAALRTDGEQISVLVPYGELTILDDWHATGLAGTGSHTVVGENVLVPAHRILPGAAMAAGEYLSERLAANRYFRVPGVPFLVANTAGAPVGIARAAYDAFLARLPGRRVTYTDYASQADAPVTHLQIAQAAMRMASAEDHMRHAARLVDAHIAGTELTTLARARVRAHAGHACAEARAAVDGLFAGSGASAIQRDVPIQRHQRDIQALSNHAFLAPLTNYELYGRVVAGLAPNTAFI